MWAIDSGNTDIVELLLSNGVDTTWKNHQGDDAISFARKEGHKAMVKLLE